MGDGAPCGRDSVGDGAPCGRDSVGDGAPCGRDSVGDGAPCGRDSVAPTDFAVSRTLGRSFQGGNQVLECGAVVVVHCHEATMGFEHPRAQLVRWKVGLG